MNPDLIAIGFGPSDFEKASFQAGRVLLNEIKMRIQNLRCFENFWNIYKELSDEWIIIDNSAKKPNLIQNSFQFEKLDNAQKNKFSLKFIKGLI